MAVKIIGGRNYGGICRNPPHFDSHNLICTNKVSYVTVTSIVRSRFYRLHTYYFHHSARPEGPSGSAFRAVLHTCKKRETRLEIYFCFIIVSLQSCQSVWKQK